MARLIWSGTHRRVTWAAGLSLILHVLALTGMVIGLKVLTPPPEGRAVELRLIPAPTLQPRSEPVRRPPERANAPATPQPRPTPQAPAESLIAALPQTPAPAPQPGAGALAEGGTKGLLPGFRERVGCNAPDTFHLSMEQRRACAEDLARLARGAPPLALNIPAAKKAEYDNYVRCLRLQQTAPVPSMDPNDPSSGAEVSPGGIVLNLGMGDPQGCVMGRW